MTAPPGRVAPEWLALRGPADDRARRQYTRHLVETLDDHLRGRAREHSTVRAVDVGAGTGAGADWLRASLTVDQDWRLLDHDPRILEATPETRRWALPVVGDVHSLGRLLADAPADVVTCQALLDILTADEIEALVAAAASSGSAMLLSLSVTGEVTLSPPHPDDDAVAAAFDAHQQRDGRMGPDACVHALDVLESHGYRTTTASAPWELGPEGPALLRAWLRGRLEAAVEQEPHQRDRFERWWLARDEAAEREELTAEVGHLDVLALPMSRMSA